MRKNYSVLLLVSLLFFLQCCNQINNKNEAKVSDDTEETMQMSDSSYLNTGQKIASDAQKVLGKNLTNAIDRGGSEYAVDFCNTHAIRLTDSVSSSLSIALKRVSDRFRNPANAANSDEEAIIRQMREQLVNGDIPEGTLRKTNEKVIGYYPIITNAMCLQCHGSATADIQSITLKKLQELYPEDKATGYTTNEIRGLWVVEMIKNL